MKHTLCNYVEILCQSYIFPCKNFMVKQFQNNIKHHVGFILVLGCHRKTLSIQIIEILRQNDSAFSRKKNHVPYSL